MAPRPPRQPPSRSPGNQTCSVRKTLGVGGFRHNQIVFRMTAPKSPDMEEFRQIIDGTANDATFDGPQGLIAAEDALYGRHRQSGLPNQPGNRRGHHPRRNRPTRSATPSSIRPRKRSPVRGSRTPRQSPSCQCRHSPTAQPDLEDGTVAVVAGTGAEAITDDTAREATLAQAASHFILQADCCFLPTVRHPPSAHCPWERTGEDLGWERFA